MRNFIVALACLALAACTNTQALTTTYVAANAFDAVEITATHYARLPRCDVAPQPCSSRALLGKIKPLILAGRSARNRMEQGLPGANADLNSAVDQLKNLFSANGIS